MHKENKRARARRSARTLRVAVSVASLVFLARTAAGYEDASGTAASVQTDLIEMPTARMEPDGELSASLDYLHNNQRYDLGFQVLPWLQAHFQYAGLSRYSPDFPVYWDRSFGFKARLWDEGDVVPSVALGVDDLIGTGIFSGEYLVASKQFGDIDTSLGMGWGTYGATNLFRNPLTYLSSSFNNRVVNGLTPGGTDFGLLFHGRDVGLFGGANWRTPIDGLSLSVEYSSNTYQRERMTGNLVPKSQVNYGVTYAIDDSVSLNVAWLYGTTLGGGASFTADPVHPQYLQKIEPPPPPVAVRTIEQRQQALAALENLRDPRKVQRVRLRESRNLGRNNFVDALWRQGNDYSAIQLEQNTLDLTVTGVVSSTRCASTARLMQGVVLHIDRIELRDDAGRRKVTCVVPRSIEAVPFSPALLSVSDLEKLATPAVQVDTIDASHVTTRPDRAKVERSIRDAVTAQHLYVEALLLGQGELVLYYTNSHFFAETDAIDRIVRVLSQQAPPDIEKFRLIAVDAGVPLKEFDVLRGPMERSYEQEGGTIFDHSVEILDPAMDQPVLAAAAKDIYPQFNWGLYPQFRQSLFDPNQPLGVQFLGVLYAGLDLAPGLSLYGSLEGNIYDDFNTARVSDSLLPHVRSDFMKYFTKGKNGIGNLDADYIFRLSPDVSAKFRAGYLESMFAGAGGEVLWRPEGARWALGADIYQVWQRDFDRLFGLQSYHQITGHVSLYYDSPWYGLNFELRAGQYLAGDRGLTLQITRRFATGVEIGAFLTKTNVSAAQFGEGSFDKGVIIRIPLSWMAPIESQSQIAMDLRPVQRDGGQALAGDATLYDITRNTSEGELLRQQPGLLDGH